MNSGGNDGRPSPPVGRELSEVTLCAIDTANTPLAARALALCRRACAFGDSLLIADQPAGGDHRFERIEPLPTRQHYSEFVLRRLAGHIATPFVLLVQWDGYIVDPDRWSDEFLHYDYIGAPWHWHGDGMTVGNGGFSLRSRRLLELMTTPGLPERGEQPEDHYICRTLRPLLESRHGIRFAPQALAERFAYECSHPEEPTFGFHGLYNMWRHLDDREVPHLAEQLADYVIPSPEYAQFLRMYYILRKFTPLLALYRRLRRTMPVTELERHLAREFGDGTAAAACVKMCERHRRHEAVPSTPPPGHPGRRSDEGP